MCSALLFSQEVEERVEPSVERSQGPCDLIAHGHHCHSIAGHSLGHLENEEDGSGDMEGEEAQGEEEGYGDDGPDRFPPAVSIRGVGTKEYRHPLMSSGHPSSPSY